MSYGGSSVVCTFLALGVLQSIHVQAAAEPRHPSAYHPRVEPRPNRERPESPGLS